MISLKQAKEDKVAEFSMYDQWLDKYEYLIELGKSLSPLPEAEKNDDNLIKGCQSRVWLSSKVEDGAIVFGADSDAIITKGIIALLVDVYSGRTAKEIAEDDFSFIDEIGLKENLSPTRSGGLQSMIATIKKTAADILSAEEKAAEESAEGSGRAPEGGDAESKEDIKAQDVLTSEDAAALSKIYSDVVLALKQVFDPEIPVNIYDLGLVYDIHIDKAGKVDILMTFTAPNCPMADEVMMEVKQQVSEVPGVSDCHIELTFDPVWDRSMLSEEARVELGLEDIEEGESYNEY